MRFAIMQTGPKKFVVGEAVTRGSTFRKLCECNTEHCAKGIKDALITAYDKSNGDTNALHQTERAR
jgi:hypothetical protein